MPCVRTCRLMSLWKQVTEKMREDWEIWDLRILTLFILLAQLFLLFFGRRRRKSRTVLMMIVNVWLLYLFTELLATTALGKLSKLNVSNDAKPDNSKTCNSSTTNSPLGKNELRVMWGPLILFYLGGPDTVTVLRAEENQLWVRQLIGLITLSTRAAYALSVTWSKQGFSLVALLIFLPALIKYGERVWVIQSRSTDNYEDVLQLDLRRVEKISPSRPNAKVVMLAFFWFQTLMPHCSGYECNRITVKTLVKHFREKVKSRSVDPFKLIEIEMGLMYDVLFSKVGMIFTIWGSILRVLSVSLMVSVLVIYFMCDMPRRPLIKVCNKPSAHFDGDHEITIILVAGAIVLEIGGTVVQLASDWALVWACKYRNQGASLVLSLHEILFSKRRRWSGVVGQFSLRDFCTNYNHSVWNRMCILLGPEKMLKRFSSEKSVAQHFKNLIIIYLMEKSERATGANTLHTSAKTRPKKVAATSTQKDVDNPQISAEKIQGGDAPVQTTGVTRGEWTLVKYDLVEQLKWSIELEFHQSLVIWHVPTEVYHRLDHGKDYTEQTAVKMLSDYMMYLLVVCPSRLRFCKKYEILQDYARMKEFFDRGSVIPSGQDLSNNTDQEKAHRLVQALEENPKRWEVMGSMWAEMLCYAAHKCNVRNHIEELQHGGQFLTHVWLLLLHFGITKKRERRGASKVENHVTIERFVKTCVDCLRDNAKTQ